MAANGFAPEKLKKIPYGNFEYVGGDINTARRE